MKTKALIIPVPFFVSLLFALFLLASGSATAQEASPTRKVVWLMTSEKYTGEIIEAVPGHHVKIRLDDGTVKTIEADDINKITDVEPLAKKIRIGKKADRRVGLSIIGSVMSGYDILSGLSYVMVEPTVCVGLRVKTHRIGLGLGFIYGSTLDPGSSAFGEYNSNSLALPELKYFPLFLNYHGDYGRHRVYASADVSFGYPAYVGRTVVYGGNSVSGDILYQKGVIFAEGGPGISVRVAPNLLLNLSAVFHFMQIQEVNGHGSRVYLVTTYGNNTRNVGTAGGALKVIF